MQIKNVFKIYCPISWDTPADHGWTPLYYEVTSLPDFLVQSERLHSNLLKPGLLPLLPPLAHSSPKKEGRLSGWKFLSMELFESLQVNEHREIHPSVRLPTFRREGHVF